MKTPILLAVTVLAVALAACGGSQNRTIDQAPPPEPTETALVRFVHAIPDGQRLSAQVGMTPVGTDVPFEGVGEWVVVPAGQHEVVLRSGEVVHFTDVYRLLPDERYVLMAYGAMSPVLDDVPAGIMMVQDEHLRYDPSEVYLRFANTVADGNPLGLRITTNDYLRLLFPRQDIGTISEYKLGPVDQNSFDVLPAHNTSLPPVMDFEYTLQAGYLYTFVVTGRQANGTIEMFPVIDHPSMRPQTSGQLAP